MTLMEETKKLLRRSMKARIAQLDAKYTRNASRSIADRLLESAEWKQAQNVFCFVGREDEIDTRAILEAALKEKKTLSVPLCTAKGVMQARIIQSLEELHPGAYGILEPHADTPEQNPQTLELCVIPCLSAAPDGTRLGYGGGYYDRFLAKAAQAFKLVLCREKLLSQDLVCEAHDCRADAVLTENKYFLHGRAEKTK